MKYTVSVYETGFPWQCIISRCSKVAILWLKVANKWKNKFALYVWYNHFNNFPNLATSPGVTEGQCRAEEGFRPNREQGSVIWSMLMPYKYGTKNTSEKRLNMERLKRRGNGKGMEQRDWEREREWEWIIANNTIDANPVPSTPPPRPPSACHKNRWSSTQLVVPASLRGLLVMSPSSAKKQLMAFQHLALVQTLTPSISGNTLELIEQW